MAIWNTPAYRRWYNIKSRCENQNNEKYSGYGGRGIFLCERWQRFDNFVADMGDPPSPTHTVGRKDNSGPYSPENCQWETPEQQANNRRTNVLVEGKTLAQHAREIGMTPEALRYRINTGKDVLNSKKQRRKNWKRTVLQKTLEGSLVASHASMRDAAESVRPDTPDTALKSIWRVLEKQRASYAGFCWEFAPQETSQ
jgi:hypothetical protein